MKLALSAARLLLTTLQGEGIPASKLQKEIAAHMVENGILRLAIQGRSKKRYFLTQKDALENYLSNHYGIRDLEAYVREIENAELSGADAIALASDSKLRKSRTFKGFLLNSLASIPATLNGETFQIQPQDGSFIFIYDYENMQIPTDVTIVGIENPENFRKLKQQQHLFEGKKVLFVSRYPQSKDILRWLKSIPNPYLHFGDFDFEGLNIYWNEFGEHLKGRASLLVPQNVEEKLQEFGNRALYAKQKLKIKLDKCDDREVHQVVALIEQYGKGLEQEVFLKP